MATAPKPKSSRNGTKKKFSSDARGIGNAGISDLAAAGSPKTLACAGSELLPSVAVSEEEKHQLIAEAAYFRAQRRNFAPGYELEDWLTAEAEIESKFSEIPS